MEGRQSVEITDYTGKKKKDTVYVEECSASDNCSECGTLWIKTPGLHKYQKKLSLPHQDDSGVSEVPREILKTTRKQISNHKLQSSPHRLSKCQVGV